MTQPKRWQTEVCPGAGDAKVTQAQGPQSQLPRNLPPASAVVPARLCGCRAGGERVPLCRRRLQDRSVSACRRLVPDLDLAPGPLPRPTHIHTHTHTHAHTHTRTHTPKQHTPTQPTHIYLPLGGGCLGPSYRRCHSRSNSRTPRPQTDFYQSKVRNQSGLRAALAQARGDSAVAQHSGNQLLFQVQVPATKPATNNY